VLVREAHTCACIQVNQLTPSDCVAHARMLGMHNTWDGERAIAVTCSFTPGSCSLTAYKLTPEGYSWAQANKDLKGTPKDYKPSFYEKARLSLGAAVLDEQHASCVYCSSSLLCILCSIMLILPAQLGCCVC
jgi:PROCT (NUC072) domain